jgi:hypothetical protein
LVSDPIRFDFTKTDEHQKLQAWHAEISDYSFPDDAEFDLLLEQARRQWDLLVELLAAGESKAEKFLATLAALAVAAVGVFRLTEASWNSWLWLPIVLGSLSALFALIARYPQRLPDVVSTRELAEWHRKVTQRAARQFFLATSHHWAVVEAKALMRFRAAHMRHAFNLAIAAGIAFVIIALAAGEPSAANRSAPTSRGGAAAAVDSSGPAALPASGQTSETPSN